MARLSDAELPPVTMAHRLAAFELMAWTGTTYAQAMQNDTRRQVLAIKAAQLRNEECDWATPRTVSLVQRCELGLDGHPIGYRTQRVPGRRSATPQASLF